MSGYLLSYTSGVIGYGLSDDLDTAMAEAEQRCESMGMGASIVNRSTYVVAAEVEWFNVNQGYKARKV